MTRPLSGMPAALRKRRYRERQAIGAKIIAVEVDPDLIEALVDLGEIAPDQTGDRGAIADAVAEVLEQTVAERRARAYERSVPRCK